MRLFVLVLNLLVGTALSTQAPDLWASTKSHKHSASHTARVRGKSKHLGKQKAVPVPGDVWVRLRSGMQIPRPQPLPEPTPANIASPALTANLDSNPTLVSSRLANSGTALMPPPQKIRLPSTANAPHYNYTPYGRLKLNTAIASRIRRDVALEKQAIRTTLNTAWQEGDGNIRLHTRIEAPALRKSHTGTAVKPQPKTETLAANYPSDPAQVGLSANKPKLAQHLSSYERVNKYIAWHSQHRTYLLQVAERARPYLYHIVESLAQYKLPYELALLPIVESAYQPTALSPKSAAGLWQFIPSTAQEFELQQTEQYDARLDITASTRAAMRFLTFLKQHFNGDWLLALAAYNCGVGTVDNAIARNRAAGLDTDYWSLQLPEETQEYVPRFLALAGIFADPETHGIKLPPVRDEPYFVKVKLDRQDDIAYLTEKELKEVAALAQLDYAQFYRLNPGYLSPKLSPDSPFTFLLPPDNAKQLLQQLGDLTQAKPLAENDGKEKIWHLQDDTKSALSLLATISLPVGADIVKVADPFLSLDVNPPSLGVAQQSTTAPALGHALKRTADNS